MKTIYHHSAPGTIRKLGWGFLFAFHSNYGSILHHCKARFGRKSWFFHTSMHSTSPLVGSPSEYCHPVWYGKNSIVGYWMVKKTEDTYNRLDRIPACNRQTDRQTSFHVIVCAIHTRRAEINYRNVTASQGNENTVGCIRKRNGGKWVGRVARARRKTQSEIDSCSDGCCLWSSFLTYSSSSSNSSFDWQQMDW